MLCTTCISANALMTLCYVPRASVSACVILSQLSRAVCDCCWRQQGGNVGAVLAPGVVILAVMVRTQFAPWLALGGAGVLAAAAAMGLPETLGMPASDTIQVASTSTQPLPAPACGRAYEHPAHACCTGGETCTGGPPRVTSVFLSGCSCCD